MLAAFRGFVHSMKPEKGLWAGGKDSKKSNNSVMRPLQGSISVEGIDHNTSSSKAFGNYYRQDLQTRSLCKACTL